MYDRILIITTKRLMRHATGVYNSCSGNLGRSVTKKLDHNIVLGCSKKLIQNPMSIILGSNSMVGVGLYKSPPLLRLQKFLCFVKNHLLFYIKNKPPSDNFYTKYVSNLYFLLSINNTIIIDTNKLMDDTHIYLKKL